MSFYTDDCKTAAEVVARAKTVRARLWGLQPPAPVLPPPPSPPPVVDPPALPAEETPTVAEQALIDLENMIAEANRPPPPPESITVRRIIELVADYFSLSYADIISERRGVHLVRPRQIAMYIAHKIVLSATYPMLARAFRRDHTTVLHGKRRIGILIGSGREDVIAAVSEVMAKFGLPMPEEAPCSLVVRLHWSRWNLDEIADLRVMYEVEGRSVPDIATALSRTEYAVTTKLYKLGYRRPKTAA